MMASFQNLWKKELTTIVGVAVQVWGHLELTGRPVDRTAQKRTGDVPVEVDVGDKLVVLPIAEADAMGVTGLAVDLEVQPVVVKQGPDVLEPVVRIRRQATTLSDRHRLWWVRAKTRPDCR